MSNINIRKLQEIQDYLMQITPLKVYDIDCKSLTELYYELAKKINEIIRSIDVVETFTIEEIQGLHTIMETLLEDELMPELERIMDDMYESGMLKELIEKILLQDITNKMNELERLARIAGAEDYFIPQPVEDCQLGNNGLPGTYNKENYNAFLEWKLEKLVREFPEYVSCTNEGIDESGEYSIYRYTFTPENYDRTIVLLGQVHGNEYTSFFSICEFLDRLTREPETDNNLMFLREKVKIVCIPIVNPWGFCNGNRRNFNGVDLNRNSSYRWDEYENSNSGPGAKYFKGDAPFSENETAIVKGVVESLLDDKLVGSIDMHTITTIQAEKILYYPRFSQNMSAKWFEILEKFKTGTPNDRRILSTSAVPTMSNWMAHQYKINACNPEWNNSCYDMQGNRTTFNMTKHMEWMVNIILSVAKENRPAQTSKVYPMVKTLIWNVNQHTNEVEDGERNSIKGHRLLNPTDNLPTTWQTTRYEFYLNNEGIVMMDGTVTVKAEKDCEILVCPLLYQQYAPESNFATMDKSDRYFQKISLKAGEEKIIPMLTSIQCYHSNYNDTESRRASYVHFRIKACSDTTDSAYITDMKVRLHYFPTTMGECLEVLRTISQGVTEVIFPLRIDHYEYED